MVTLQRLRGRLWLENPNDDRPVERVLDSFPNDGSAGIVHLFHQTEPVFFYEFRIHSYGTILKLNVT